MGVWAAAATALALWLAPASARAEIHALLIANGAYRSGIPPLAGAARDGANAEAIARAMGASPHNIRRVENADHAALVRAFDELLSRVRRDDRVLIYFSGHGGRWRSEAETRCAESLVTVDAGHFSDSSLEAVVNRLAANAEKVFLFIDACHSGGVASRSLASSGLSPKYWEGEPGKSCDKPVNVLARGLTRGAKGNPFAGNIVLMAAAKADESAFDGPEGGIATNAWRQCLEEGGDADGSGGLTARELQACAQGKVERRLAGAEGIRPPHIEVKGNADAVLSLAGPAPAPAAESTPAPPPPPPPPPSAAQTPALAPPAVEAPSAKPMPERTLADIHASRDARRTVSLKLPSKRAKIGGAPLDFTVTSSHAGHLYILMVGSDRTTFDLLFPNTLDADNRVRAGVPVRLPRPSWTLAPKGPAGKDRLLAIVADTPRDFSSLGMKPAGPFSILPAAAEGAARGLQRAALSGCTGAPDCSNAYGATMADIEEVP